ncbi:hypothetical protein HYT57_00995 [Candidatus Woesearchaeota archaeon]|nr:hypothetical protein [Candidatus Woesearchaeota archaeon]
MDAKNGKYYKEVYFLVIMGVLNWLTKSRKAEPGDVNPGVWGGAVVATLISTVIIVLSSMSGEVNASNVNEVARRNNLTQEQVRALDRAVSLNLSQKTIERSIHVAESLKADLGIIKRDLDSRNLREALHGVINAKSLVEELQKLGVFETNAAKAELDSLRVELASRIGQKN